MLNKLTPLQYSQIISMANANNCGCVYPLSVAEGIQEGDIFTGSIDNFEKALFWT